jgi:uncharacterized protein (DUF1684 family)
VIFGSSVAARALALAAIVTTTAACRLAPTEAADYVSKVAAARVAKDQQFKNTNRPLPESRKAKFLPLAYYPVDPDYNVPGVLKMSKERPTLMMPTSTGSQRQMRRVGSVEFMLQNERMKLTAFIEVGAPDLNLLFVPFTDPTNGTETYPAGRYMDLRRSETGAYDVDFNSAYLPFCYFNETYECPYPPAENRLTVPIHAGERLKP